MALESHQLRGIIPPIISPLQADGQIDHPSVQRLIDHLVDGGVHAIFVLGTTGEGVSLSYKKRQELVESTSAAVNRRLPLLVGITDTSLEEAIEFSAFCADAGADAVVAAPPYYLPIDQSQLLSFYSLLADSTELPMVLYNMPSCVKVSIEPSTVLELVSHPRIIGMKDSGGDIAYFRNLASMLNGKEFPLIMGPEHLLGSALRSGGAGGVHGGANLWPRLYTNLYEAHRSGNRELASACEAMIQRVCKSLYTIRGGRAMTTESIKAVLEFYGIAQRWLAPPLLAPEENLYRQWIAAAQSIESDLEGLIPKVASTPK